MTFLEAKNKEISNKEIKKLYLEIAPKLKGVAYRYCKDESKAEDYVHDAFIIIISKLHTFRAESNIKTWATRILINVILGDKQKAKFFDDIDTLESEFEDNADSTLTIIANNEILSSVMKLPEGKRIIFNLYVVEGYSHEEIAQMLNISEGTSKSQLAKAKQILRSIYQNNRYE